MALWTLAQLVERLSQETVNQILDDNRDETPDAGPVARLQADSQSFVLGFLRGTYDITVIIASPPNEVVRLALDAAVWMAKKRWPRYTGGDWKDDYGINRQELMDLRATKTRLDVAGAPEPPANVGGSTSSGDPLNPTLVELTFNGPGFLGDY